jgi:hypothetical protein
LLRACFAIPGKRAKNEPVPPPTDRQLRWRIDRLRDLGVPTLATARLLELTVEEVERLQQLPSRRKRKDRP